MVLKIHMIHIYRQTYNEREREQERGRYKQTDKQRMRERKIAKTHEMKKNDEARIVAMIDRQ